MRVNESIQKAKENGINVKTKDIGVLLWPESAYTAQMQSARNLKNGRTTRLSGEQVRKFCKLTGVDANFLYNINQ